MRQHPRCPKGSNRAMLVAAALVAFAASGCSERLPTDPMAGNEPTATNPRVVVKAAASPTTTAPTWTWYTLASKWVNKGEAATVSGGRYELQLVRGSLGQGATITIQERDPSVTDMVVGPKGTVLTRAATLKINYAGSTVEAGGALLKLYRLNDSTGMWEAVAGTNDLAAKTFTAKVSVLCRYALSPTDPTKAGW